MERLPTQEKELRELMHDTDNPQLKRAIQRRLTDIEKQTDNENTTIRK